MKIDYFPSKKQNSLDQKFSIVIPTWNNLDYIKLCITSIQNNSHFKHQIIIHVNDGSDGTLNWIRSKEFDYTVSNTNIGICWAVNAAASLAQTDYIVYMNDDMYVLPDWDLHLMNEIQQLPDDHFFLSSTMIEPTDSNNPCVIFTDKFGDNIDNFREDELLSEYNNFQMHDWSGATWPPNIVSRRMWQQVGGYSVEFSPGMASDPDFSMKLWQAGVRYFKGLSNSRVYHFQCKSTGRIVKNKGKKQFQKKWGLTVPSFVSNYLLRGEIFNGPLKAPVKNERKKILGRFF